MRLLIGLGNHAQIVDRIVLARVGEPLVGPGSQDDLQVLLKAFPALSVGDVIALVGPHEPAAAHAKIDPSVADLVQGGDLFGHADWVV